MHGDKLKIKKKLKKVGVAVLLVALAPIVTMTGVWSEASSKTGSTCM